MIAATALAQGLPLYTTNPADLTGLESLARIPVTRSLLPARAAIELTARDIPVGR